MTILEAVKTILSKEPGGLTCKEITERILSENLYSFNAQDPNAIVGHSLRKHCKGLSSRLLILSNIFTLFRGNVEQLYIAS